MDYEEEQAEWSVANELLRGRVHRLLGDTNQAQRTLEGALRESESKYGSNNIRKLEHYLIRCSMTFSHYVCYEYCCLIFRSLVK